MEKKREGEGEGRKRKDSQSEFRGLIKVLGLLCKGLNT